MPRNVRTLLVINYFAMTTAMVALFATRVMQASVSSSHIFVGGELVGTDISELMAQHHPSAIEEMLRIGASMKEAGWSIYAAGSEPVSQLDQFLDLIISPAAVIGFSLVFLIVFANSYYSMLVSSDRVGRIFWNTEETPPRILGDVVFRLFGSLLLGVLGSFLATAGWEFLRWLQ